ncbi:hypothetical protein LTR56_000546 [Elasticomyces elasticus]|nr:hypothetical protein LTR56_000546 [Elasticomyces elasticus]KAK3664322.1 hypothetical protein LTR22_004735 [Elasticomyces elasticus]KAK4915432.1 hypothetical protein LTR49_016420 [Elasticomyces elasticus]KAK5752815.1 hypothetical protein LTS12_017094 [Elasticomyces elasticus]
MSTMVPAEEVKAPRCRLLELPEELQLQIYELVVIAKAPIRISHLRCVGCLRAHNFEENMDASLAPFFSERKQPALSRTCRTIRNIVLPIYYKRNSFRVCLFCNNRHRIASRTWLLSMGGANRALLKGFEVYQEVGYGDRHDTDPIVILTQGMQGLKVQGSGLDSTLASKACHRWQITFAE